MKGFQEKSEINEKEQQRENLKTCDGIAFDICTKPVQRIGKRKKKRKLKMAWKIKSLKPRPSIQIQKHWPGEI